MGLVMICYLSSLRRRRCNASGISSNLGARGTGIRGIGMRGTGIRGMGTRGVMPRGLGTRGLGFARMMASQ